MCILASRRATTALSACERGRTSKCRSKYAGDRECDARGCMPGDEGQDLLEYALLVALIAIVAVGAVELAGVEVSDIFTTITDELSTAGS
jgi:Flp pilus assembly pilin Flp